MSASALLLVAQSLVGQAAYAQSPAPEAEQALPAAAADEAATPPAEVVAAAAPAEEPTPAVTEVAQAGSLEEVVITGSRVVRNGYEAPTPVNVLSTEEILAEAPANIADFINTLPSIRGSTTASSSSGGLSSGTAGISALNLRALGTGRTLVLFDGQRSVVSAGTGQVDTNTFPQALIERVEVVTGGASSAYGSDAIGGVVNFILDRDYTGVKGSLEYGETTYGDAENRKFSLTAGTPFAGGRGHVLFSGEVSGQNGIHYTTRDWAENGYFVMRNPDTTPGAPYYSVGEQTGIATYTPGGLITAGPLKGTYFGVNGTLNQLAYGATSPGQWMRGGDWQYSTSGILGTNSLQSDEDRQSAFGRISFNVLPGVELFGQASYARFEGLSYYINPTTNGVVIQNDNAYISQDLRDMLDANSLTSFTLGTSNADMPASGSANVRETQRYVIGANGDFNLFNKGIKWDAYYQAGITDVEEQLTSTYNVQRLTWATDAVFNEAGDIVCRATRDGVAGAEDCVPLNRMGVGVGSQAGLDYVLGEPLRTQQFTQDVVAVNFSTNDVQGWAGPISFATGIEHRVEEISGEVDPQYNTGWKYGNYLVTAGDYDVSEIYLETVVPIFQGFDFNGAARRTDYSTSGGVTTWKAGFTYTPIADVTFRASKSRDIRAPNLSELYATGTGRTNSVLINGVSTSFVQKLQGSTLLKPEVGDTIGAGFVFQPRFLPGAALSVDYYQIEISSLIDSLSAEQTVAYCYDNDVQKYCDNINFNEETGVLETIDLYYENLNSMKAKGLDVEASYRIGLQEIFAAGLGDLAVRAMATHYIENVTDNGVTAIDLAGSNANSTPDWVYRVSAMYTLDPWTINLTARGVSSGVISNAYTECTSDCPTVASPYFTINDNQVGGAIYYDASFNRSFTIAGADAEIFLAIKNLLNTDPELVSNPGSVAAENTPGYIQTNRSLYDVLGRTFRLGVRFEF